MKIVLISLVALISASSVWANGYTPKPGSCTTGGMGKGLCSCDLVSTTDSPTMVPDTIHSDTVSCGLLACSDFVDAVNCGGLKEAFCGLTNPYYTGVCSQEVRFDPTVVGAGDACANVARELNNPYSYGRDYCNATSIHGGWNLISVGDSPTP